MLGLSVWLELLGWRIIHSGLSLSQAWSGVFVAGVLRTASGAAVSGFVIAGAGLISSRTRTWVFTNFALIWGFGAGAFLLAIAALILWAP